MKTARHDRRTLWLTAGLMLALGLVGAAARADAQITCIPSTTPCQTCPAPTPCPPPTNTTCGGGGGSGNITSSTSTATCAGSVAQTTHTTTSIIGPANICIGDNQSQGFHVCPGTVNFNTNTDTITAGVAIPTLSVWALCALAVALGALALRHLGGLRPTQA